MERTLREQRDEVPARNGKGLVKRYIVKMSGQSRAQVTLLNGSEFINHDVVTVLNKLLVEQTDEAARIAA